MHRHSYDRVHVQGQASPGSHLMTVSATDPDEETEGLRYAISGAIRTPKQVCSRFLLNFRSN